MDWIDVALRSTFVGLSMKWGEVGKSGQSFHDSRQHGDFGECGWGCSNRSLEPLSRLLAGLFGVGLGRNGN